MEQCWATQVGGPKCARDAGIFERGTSVRRQFQQGAHGLQQPASRPCGSCFRAPSKRLSGRRGRIPEVPDSLHGCSCTTACRQETSEKPSRHGDYCGLPPNRKVCPSTSTCCSIPYNTGRKRRQQWIGFLRNFWGIWRKPFGRRGRGGSYWCYSLLPRQRGVPLDPWCGLSSLRDARASSQRLPGGPYC